MVIGIDGSRAFVKGRTGTENYSYQLIKALSKIDNKNNYKVFIRKSVTLEEFPNNFQFIVIDWPRLWTQGGLALETFKNKLDLLFVPSHTIPLIRKIGLKTVITVHDLGSEYLPAMHQLKQRLYLGFMQNYQLNTATKIIAVSKATKEDLVKKIGIESKKIAVIYEGFDKELFKTSKDDILIDRLTQLGIKKDNYYLFVGTVQPRKNLEKIIQAFASFQSNNTTLVIAGQKGWKNDEIYSLPKKLGIENRVKFLGYISDKDLLYLYNGAKALLFPSLFEGFGLPILEAQACGCPVLTSQISSMKEVAGEGAVLVNPYEVDDIVKGMEKLENRAFRKQLIKRGFENINQFSWEKCATQTLKIFEEVGSI